MLSFEGYTPQMFSVFLESLPLGVQFLIKLFCYAEGDIWGVHNGNNSKDLDDFDDTCCPPDSLERI